MDERRDELALCEDAACEPVTVCDLRSDGGLSYATGASDS